MDDLSQNELLSGYLDGELTAEEQSRVEQLLSANPAARQLVEELRALSSTLQGMPTCELGEDLSRRVLRLAERRILAGSDDALCGAQPVGSARSIAGVSWRSLSRRMLSPRSLAWSGLAVAVAVMLMLFNPAERQPPRGDLVAVRDEEPPAPSAPHTIGARPAENGELAAERLAVEDEFEVADAAPAETPVVSKAAPALKEKTAERPTMGKKAFGGREAVGKRTMDTGLGGGLGGGMPARPKANGPIAGRDADKLQLGLADLDEGRTARGLAAHAGATIVLCDIQAGADYQQVLNDVFARQQIAWDEPPAAGYRFANQRAVSQPEAAAKSYGPRSAHDARKSFSAKAPEVPGGRSEIGGLREDRSGGLPDGPSVAAGGLDLVYVTATAAQIEGTMTALAERTAVFSSITVKPARGVQGQPVLDRLQRGRAERRRSAGQAKGGMGLVEGKAALGRPVAEAARPVAKEARPVRGEQIPQAIARRLLIPGEDFARRHPQPVAGKFAPSPASQAATQPAAQQAQQLNRAAQQRAAQQQVEQEIPSTVHPPAKPEDQPTLQQAPPAEPPMQLETQKAEVSKPTRAKDAKRPEAKAVQKDAPKGDAPDTEAPSKAVAEQKRATTGREPKPEAEQQKQLRQQEEIEPLEEQPATCRVLFVFRVLPPGERGDVQLFRNNEAEK